MPTPGKPVGKREWEEAIWSEDGPPIPSIRHVLLALARHLGAETGECWPSSERLARMTGYTGRTVRTSLIQAEETGWLIRRSRGNGRTYLYSPSIPAPTSPDPGNDFQGQSDTTPEMISRVETGEPRKILPGSRAGTPETISRDPGNSFQGPRKPFPPEPYKEPPKEPTNDPPYVPPYALPGAKSPPELDPVHALLLDANRHNSTWKDEHPKANEVVDWWIQLRGMKRPPEGAIGKQGAAAKRIADRYPRKDILRALIGITELYPYGHPKMEPWDLFDLEKRFLKAHDAFERHPDVQTWLLQARLEAEDTIGGRR